MAEENSTPPPRRNPLAGFLPNREVFFTPVIIIANVLVFVAMVASGISLTMPDGEAVLRWGANFREYTVLHGERWRLLTAMFLHFGIVHIAANMYAFYNIGRLLESFIGKWRFIIMYLATGIAASIASVWWTGFSVSAGASGAILGEVGVLFALLTTNLIKKDVRMRLLRSLGISLILTLGIGFTGFIDNAGHFGGFITGMIGGYLIYFEMKAWYMERRRIYIFTALSVLLIGGICAFFWIKTPRDRSADSMLATFEQQDNLAIDYYKKINSTTSAEQVRQNLVVRWENCAEISDSLVAIPHTPGTARKYFGTLQQYAGYRLKSGQYVYRMISENDSTFGDSANAFTKKAQTLMEEIAAERKAIGE